MNRKIHIKSSKPPTVEIDTDAGCAYIRFSNATVARTIPQGSGPGVIATIDFDQNNHVVGIELISVREFNITRLLVLAKITVTVPKELLYKARYIPAPAQAELAAA